MTRASANRVQYRIGLQSAFDTAATTTGVWAGAVTDTLQPVPEDIESDEETGSLMVSDQLRVGMATRGDVNVEWRYGAHSAALPVVLNSAGWSTELADPGGAVTVTPANSGGVNQITLSAGTWDSVLSGTLSQGMWIYIAGFSNAVNNGYWRVESDPASATIQLGGAKTMTSETAVAFSSLIVLGLAQIVNGTTLTYTSLERYYADQSSTAQYAQFLNQVTTGMQVGYDSAKGILGGSFSFIGSHEQSSSSALDSSPNAATTNVQITSADVWGFVEGTNAVAPQPIVDFSLRVQKGDFGMDELGSLRPQEFNVGRINVTGSFTTHYSDETLYDKAKSESGSQVNALALIIENSAGSYIFDIPKPSLMNPRRVRPRRDGPVLCQFDFRGAYDATSAAGIRICRRSA